MSRWGEWRSGEGGGGVFVSRTTNTQRSELGNDPRSARYRVGVVRAGECGNHIWSSSRVEVGRARWIEQDAVPWWLLLQPFCTRARCVLKFSFFNCHCTSLAGSVEKKQRQQKPTGGARPVKRPAQYWKTSIGAGLAQSVHSVRALSTII